MMSGHILVVDDSPTVRKLVELTFRGTSWRIGFASSGGEALLLAKQTLPDVMLLDLVLPDMRGTDVCERLAADATTSKIPVVIMSGKETAADICRDYRSVVSCLVKPSTPEKIRSEVEAAASRRKASNVPVATRASLADKEAAAKALYLHLRDAFSNIPRWMGELGDKPAATFFARKVLTPQLTGALLDALAPHFRELFAKHGAEPESAAVGASAGTFSGKLRGWPIIAIITFFESSARTGSLTLRQESKEITAYLKSGEIVTVTTHDPIEYMRGLSWPNRKKIPPETIKAAGNEQQRSGTPVLVTLAALGHFPPGDLTEAMATQGRRLLMDALGTGDATFEWHDIDVLPAYVEAHGRHVSTARNTLRFGDGDQDTEGAPQHALEELRQSPSPRTFAPTTVFTRPRGFSAYVLKFSLTAAERQVLTLVDGRSTAEQLAHSAELDLAEALAILARLNEVRLLSVAAATAPDRGTASPRRRAVMIMEPDQEGFQRPLANMLESRREPIALLDLAGEQDLLAAIRRERPQRVLLNAAVVPVSDTLRAVRSDPELSDVTVVAILEPEMAPKLSEFAAAGFDRVLVKPITRAEIEQLFPG